MNTAPTPVLGHSAPAWAWAGVHACGGAVLTLTAWLVLLQVGMALSWNWLGGMLPLALWWVWLALAPLGRRGQRPGVALVAALGVALGVCMAQMAGRGVWGWVGAALLAVSWAQWVLAVRPWRGPVWALAQRHPLWVTAAVQALAWGVAAWLAADPLAWATRWVALPVLCWVWALCWMAWHGQCPHDRPRLFSDPPSAMPTGPLAHPAMALMMAWLLPMGQWCVALGWTHTEAVLAHGLVMVLAQAWAHARPDLGARWGTGLVLAGAGVWGWGSGWPAMWLAMALVAVGTAGHRPPPNAQWSAWAWLAVALPALGWVGQMAAVRGPQAMAEALAWVAVACAVRYMAQSGHTRISA
jgi:hypothetical protein